MYPASFTEGRLISTPDAEAGSGGRWGALEMRRYLSPPAVQAAKARPPGRRPRESGGGVRSPAPKARVRRPFPGFPALLKRWVQTVCPPGYSRSKPINIARGTPKVRRTCGSIPDFGKPRCREASRSAGPFGPRGSARPRFSPTAAEFRRRPTRGRKEYG